MVKENDILELRFFGNDVNPSNVRPSEVADLIKGFEKALLCEIKGRNPQYDTNQILFTFEQIKNESLGLAFRPKIIKDIVLTSYTAISSCFATGDFSELDNKTIKELKTLTAFSKRYNCAAEFKLKGETISSFTPQTEIQYNKNPIIKGDIKIFGRVIDAGGNNPNVHIKLDNENELIFATTEAHAKQLAHKLYEKVNLVGNAKWDAVTYEIKEFKLTDILDFTTGKTLSAINELKNLTSGYWDKFNTNDDINKHLLRD